APIGSMLCGPKDFIAEARRNRKLVGGGMRQVGVLAAAGIVALETMIERLEDDHANARLLAQGLSGIPNVVLDSTVPASIMVYFRLVSTAPCGPVELARRVQPRGLLLEFDPNPRIRLVTHYWVNAADVRKAVSILGDALAN